MKTKIVYCLVSSNDDLYLEQAWISIYSLRKYNPTAYIILMVDDTTACTLEGTRANIKNLLSELKVITTPEEYDAKERSRFLKTNFRHFAEGDLLFIDADTIIGGPLADIDRIQCEIACVPDYHVKFKEIPLYNQLSNRIYDIFNVDTSDADYYFNSGVIYVKDTPRTHSFFYDWYENWKHSAFDKGCCLDQPSLFATDKKYGYIIKQLPGIYNSQILYSMQYMINGVIFHFFNTTAVEDVEQLSPFYEKRLYFQLKEKGQIDGELADILNDSNTWIKSPSYFVCKSKYLFLTSPVGVGMYSHCLSKSFFYRLLQKYCKYKLS